MSKTSYENLSPYCMYINVTNTRLGRRHTIMILPFAHTLKPFHCTHQVHTVKFDVPAGFIVALRRSIFLCLRIVGVRENAISVCSTRFLHSLT